MSNALSEEQKQQGIALGKLGWSLRKIERETGVRRETAGAYLVGRSGLRYDPGAWRRQAPAKRANEVTPDFVGLLSQPPGCPRRWDHPHRARGRSPSRALWYATRKRASTGGPGCSC